MYFTHPIPALLAVSTLNTLRQRMFDDTFAGIHRLGWFDWALLIPYFGILGLLSVYGLHRFDTIHTYFKHRKQRHCRTASALRKVAAGYDSAAPL